MGQTQSGRWKKSMNFYFLFSKRVDKFYLFLPSPQRGGMTSDSECKRKRDLGKKENSGGRLQINKEKWETIEQLDPAEDDFSQQRNNILSIDRFSSICHARVSLLTTLSHCRTPQGMLKVAGEHLTMDLNKPLAAPKKDWICAPVRIMGSENQRADQVLVVWNRFSVP